MNYTIQFISVKTYEANSIEEATKKLYKDMDSDFIKIIDYEVTENE